MPRNGRKEENGLSLRRQRAPEETPHGARKFAPDDLRSSTTYLALRSQNPAGKWAAGDVAGCSVLILNPFLSDLDAMVRSASTNLMSGSVPESDNKPSALQACRSSRVSRLRP